MMWSRSQTMTMQRSMYESARDQLGHNGYVQYEISNWARPGHRSLHNMTYWQHNHYLGLGLSAHGYLADQRYDNVRGLRHYMTRLDRGLSPTLHQQTVDAARARADALMVGLRLTDGLEISAFDQRFGGDLLCSHQAAIARFTAGGMMEVADNHLRLLPRAYLVANQVWQAFI